MRRVVMMALMGSALAGCSPSGGPTADDQQAQQTEELQRRSQAEVGIAQPTNFTRKRLANRIIQMLDSPNLATVSYAQGLDGRLRCIGRSIGFPLPAATQTTNPSRIADQGVNYGYAILPQPEPDGLFSPTSEDATWIVLVNAKGEPSPAYFEGHVQTFLEGSKPDASLIAQDCT